MPHPFQNLARGPSSPQHFLNEFGRISKWIFVGRGWTSPPPKWHCHYLPCLYHHFSESHTSNYCLNIRSIILLRGKTMQNYSFVGIVLPCQGWRQEFSDEGMTPPTRGLKYGFQGTINAKNLRKNRVSPSDGGATMFRRGAITL